MQVMYLHNADAAFPLQNCVARALYDNVAESPDELEFRKGDLLTVLEQNTAGLEGWWLCCLRGRQVRGGGAGGERLGVWVKLASAMGTNN